jgi:hypothetical protein
MWPTSLLCVVVLQPPPPPTHPTPPHPTNTTHAEPAPAAAAVARTLQALYVMLATTSHAQRMLSPSGSMVRPLRHTYNNWPLTFSDGACDVSFLGDSFTPSELHKPLKSHASITDSFVWRSHQQKATAPLVI